MKVTVIALLALAGIVALVQAQPAAPAKDSRSILDALTVGQWITLDWSSESLAVTAVAKPADTTIEQIHAQLQKSRQDASDRRGGRRDGPDENAVLAVAEDGPAKLPYRRPPYEITSIGEDHIVVTDGGDSERWIAKQAIRWISRKLPGK